MNIVNFIIPGMVVGKVVFANIRIRSILCSIFLIVIFVPFPVLLVILVGMIALFLVNLLPVGVPGRKAVSDMTLACVICICITVVSCCAICAYVECRQSDFEDIRQDLALLRSDHDKLKDHVENLETDFYKYDED
ncbi:MAG TPA: hypothetical protein DEF67_01125 [Lachnospiraceae bacterium]|nr:hypothetical protein [Lachnospiraceae bacterium]